MKNTKWNNFSNEDLLNIIRELYKEIGYVSYDKYRKIAKERMLPNIRVFLNRFKPLKWIDVVNILEMKKDIKNNINKIKSIRKKSIRKKTNKEPRMQVTINEIIRISELLGRCPTKVEYDKYNNGGYYYSSIGKVFKISFKQLCEKYIGKNKIKGIRKLPNNLSNDELKEKLKNELIDLYNETGIVPIQNDLKKYNLFSLNTYMRVFNKCYNEILNECGLKVNTRYSVERKDEDLLCDFYNLFFKLGHIPVGREFLENNIEGKWIYLKRFNSIQNVCKILNIDYEKYYKPISAGMICLDDNKEICKSIIEKDISNFFILNNLNFIKEYKYKNLIKCDRRKFDWMVVVNNKQYYIEYAGMYKENEGQQSLRKYNKRICKKIEDLKQHGYLFQCLFIYPSDIKNKSLKEIFDNFFNLNLINSNYSKYTNITKYNDLSNEDILKLFMNYYNKNNKFKCTDLIKCNYSLYSEIRKRYKFWSNFLQQNNILKIK